MTAKVIHLDDHRHRTSRDRDDQVIEVFETPLADWSKPATTQQQKRSNSKR